MDVSGLRTARVTALLVVVLASTSACSSCRRTSAPPRVRRHERQPPPRCAVGVGHRAGRCSCFRDCLREPGRPRDCAASPASRITASDLGAGSPARGDRRPRAGPEQHAAPVVVRCREGGRRRPTTVEGETGAPDYRHEAVAGGALYYDPVVARGCAEVAVTKSEAEVVGRLARRHLAVMGVGGALVWLFWASRSSWDPEMRLWKAVGDGALILLLVTVALGPLGRLSRPVRRWLPWRRETGIWFGLLATSHALLILNGWARWSLERLFGYEFIPQLGRTARMEPGFGSRTCWACSPSRGRPHWWPRPPIERSGGSGRPRGSGCTTRPRRSSGS